MAELLDNYIKSMLYTFILFGGGILSSTLSQHNYGFIGRKSAELYYNLETVLKELYKPENVRIGSLRLTNAFTTTCIPKPKFGLDTTKKRKPFIAIESNHLTARGVIARKFATRTKGMVIKTPARCLTRFQRFYRAPNRLHPAYYALSMYAVAYNVSLNFHTRPIIITGYWMDRAIGIISRAFENQSLPPPEDDIYEWPADLLAPDITFFLYAPIDRVIPPVTKRPLEGWKKNMLPVSRRIRGTFVIQISTDIEYNTIVDIMVEHLHNWYKEYLDTDFLNVTSTRPEHLNYTALFDR